MTTYLDPEQGLAVLARLGLHVRDEGLFFSALARPSTSAFGNDAYDSLELKAAALMSSLAQNHALFDGNKRTSWVIAVAFLNINGWDLKMSEDEKFDLILAVAEGEIALEELAETFSRHLAGFALLREGLL
ncbi:MAG TPA: type II toxin-antitoxin system death-on-curing family toxin [Terrimesophilobacter sp.]|nr:type II toxin-antitoxin system death-on-curing family toxin [Terrimesophilobacter sp.]